MVFNSWLFVQNKKVRYLLSVVVVVDDDDDDKVLFSCSGLPEECKVQTPAFTDAVRLYRQAHGQYGTWDMMCGTPPQVKHTYFYASWEALVGFFLFGS